MKTPPKPIIPESVNPKGRRDPAIARQSAQTINLRSTLKGQIRCLEPLLHNAFVSLKIPNLGDYVEQYGLPLASQKAQFIHEVVERNRKLQKEHEQKTKPGADRHQDTEEVKKFARQVRRQRIHDRTSFLTLRVNKHALHNIVNAHDRHKLTHSERAASEARQDTNSSPADLIHGLQTASVASTYLVKAPECFDLSHSTCPKHGAQQEFLLTPPESHSSPQLFLGNSDENLPDRLSPEPTNTMSDPAVQDVGGIDDKIKDVIQNLYEFQQHIQGFRPEQQDGMLTKVDHIASSLKDLHAASQDEANPVQHIRVAPDIIDYVDAGRNPDIYTREFVELVQRGNSVMKGKQKAFRDFSRIFAKALKDNFDGMDDEVDTIMRHSGVEERDGHFDLTQQNGHSA